MQITLLPRTGKKLLYFFFPSQIDILLTNKNLF